IKAAGGVVIVQKPSTAEFESMPAIAVSTGFSDYVLPPQEIGPKVKQCVERLSSGPVSDAGASLDLSTIHRESLFNLLLGKTHIHFEHYKKNVVARRVYRRMGLTAVPSPDKYIALLHEDPNEVSSLANDLMIGVTGFFRDPDAWEVLKKDLIKDLAANGQADKPLRVWVPACSTGEEAYSIAMALHLETELSGKPRPIHVFATDINEKALHYARKGIYPASISADVPAEYLRRYFTAQHDGVSMRINKNVRDIVAFARQNVLTDPPFSKLDLIVCRNLFIYLEPQAQEKCLGLFHYALNPEGHLFMGNAESVGKRYALFKPAGNKKCRLYIRVNSDGSHWNAPPLQTVPVRHPIGATVWPLAPGDQSIQSVAQRALLEKYAPAVVAIDEASTIVYFNGPTNKFLSQPGGKPTNKLLNQVPENVRIGLRRLISQVMHDDVTRTLRASFPGENRRVTISVSRLTEENKLSAVSFEEKAGKGPVEETAADSGGTDEPVIRQLEHELAITRDDLQSHIEQLKSLNEEMHSSNEELQASNEELETSQEELQSVNEELVTVNTQLQDTVEAQTATNNDLSNFFVSTDIPTLFLDRDLRIKRFTPAMTRLVNLIDADVGRPFIELAQNNIGPELSADAVEVLGKLSAVTREVECGGTWFIRQALPYRTSDNRIEGVVVTFVDITRRKKDEDEIRVLAKFPSENPNPILRISRECVVLYANEAGRPLLDMWKCSCGDKVPEAWRRTIGEIFDKGDERTVEIQCGDQIYSFVIVPIANAGYVNWYGRNVTKRKHAEEELIENESKYRGLFENMTEEVHFWKLVRDNEGRIVTWRLVDANPPTLKTWGKDRDQILGKTTDEIFGPGSTEHYMPIVEKIFNEGKPYSYEDYFPQLDKYFRFTSVPMAEHFITTGADITGIKKSEEALRQSEDRFRVIAETVPALVCVTRAEDAIVLFTNEVNNKAFGLRGEEIIGTKGPDYYCDPADRKKMVDLFKKEGFVDGYRLKVKKADGTPFWIMTSVRSLVYNGQLAMIGASIDITEYKRLEDQLRVQADILQSVADAVVVTDLSFTIISWNEPAKRIYGWNAEEALGKPIKDVVRSEMSDEKRMAIYKSAQEGEANFTEVVQRTKDGRAIYVECHSMPLRDSTGVITGFVTVNRDVSERRRAEEALRNNVRLLEDVMDGCPSPIFLKDNEGKFIT
ncbi:MAG: CheR family methyltransferase, partial [Chitinivibrionales bacterium]